MKKEHIFIIALVVLIVGIFTLAFFANKQSKMDKNPELTSTLEYIAQSLNDKGVKFYGASWCPHCAEQKAFFKAAVKKLPYIECSTAGAGSPQTQICMDAKITGYPTWEFKKDTRVTLVIDPLDLSEIMGIPLDDTQKSQLTPNKDKYLAEMNEKQRDLYNKEVSELKTKLNPVKK